MFILYAYKLFLKFSSEYIHTNYFFYCFECCHRVCPNLSSAPCIYSRNYEPFSKEIHFPSVITEAEPLAGLHVPEDVYNRSVEP
jgi:hypothetical protein